MPTAPRLALAVLPSASAKLQSQRLARALAHLWNAHQRPTACWMGKNFEEKAKGGKVKAKGGKVIVVAFCWQQHSDPGDVPWTTISVAGIQTGLC